MNPAAVLYTATPAVPASSTTLAWVQARAEQIIAFCAAQRVPIASLWLEASAAFTARLAAQLDAAGIERFADNEQLWGFNCGVFPVWVVVSSDPEPWCGDDGFYFSVDALQLRWTNLLSDLAGIAYDRPVSTAEAELIFTLRTVDGLDAAAAAAVAAAIVAGP